MRRKAGIIFALIASLLLIASCKEPNVYTSLGIYDPLKESKGEIETITLHAGRGFNLLDISNDYRGIINLEYTPRENHQILKQLSQDEITALVQTLYYVSRYGNLDEYLSTPLDVRTEEACTSTKVFAYTIIEEVGTCTLNIAAEIDKVYPELNTEAIADFFKQFKALLDPSKGCSTIKDYIAIQLTVDMLASTIDMLYQILVTLPSEVTEYVWDEIIMDRAFWSAEGTIRIIRDNAIALVAILLDAVSEIDLVGSDIPSFIDLSTIIGEFI